MKRFLTVLLALISFTLTAALTLGAFLFAMPPEYGVPITFLGAAAFITWRKQVIGFWEDALGDGS